MKETVEKMKKGNKKERNTVKMNERLRKEKEE